jgi:ribonuclease T2
MRFRLSGWLVAAILAFAAFLWPAGAGRAMAADFDFYVLSLSWSPSWCAANDRNGRTAQCNSRRSYSFIVHGLWPQNERTWPEDCASSEPDRVPERLLRNYFDLIPSAGLAGHEWRKHGTCSGLSQARYFGMIRAAYLRVKIPPLVFNGAIDRRLASDDIEKLFMTANPGLPRDGISLSCASGQLSEVRICMTKSLDFRACAQVDRNACRQRILSIPAIP